MKQFYTCVFSILAIFLITAASSSARAQGLNEIISKLKQELATDPPEKKRATILSDLTWYYASVSIDSALFYGRKAVAASQQLQDSVLLAQVYSDLGAVHFRNNDFRNSEKNYLRSYGIRKKQKNAAGLAKLSNNLASVYQSTFQYKKAMAMYLEALAYFEKTGDEKNENFTRANIGLLYIDLKEYDNAIRYIRQTITYFEGQERTVEMENKLCENYLNLGKAYQMKKEYRPAEIYYTKSAAICDKVGNKQGFAFSNRNIGNLHTLRKNDSLAAEKLVISEVARKEFNSRVDQESNRIDVAQSLIVQGKFDEAKKHLLRILPLFEQEDSKENTLSTYKLLTNIYHHTGRPDSADYFFEKYIAADNELVNTYTNREASELEKKYQSLRKDNEILAQRSAVYRRNVMVASLLGLLLLGGLYYRNYRNKQKVVLQKEIMHQQDLATRAVMNAEDNERKRMATHLHDGIGQLLTAAHMNISVLEEYRGEEQNFSETLNKTQHILSEAITDVRTLSHQIMPNMLIKNSLADALRDLIAKTKSPRLHIDLKIEGLKDDLNQNVQIVLYRIIQECISNTIRHAEADAVEINVTQKDGLLRAIFRDNGKGFNVNTVHRKEGLGLENIRSRIDLLQGKLNIDSGKGRGTEITIEIPV